MLLAETESMIDELNAVPDDSAYRELLAALVRGEKFAKESVRLVLDEAGVTPAQLASDFQLLRRRREAAEFFARPAAEGETEELDRLDTEVESLRGKASQLRAEYLAAEAECNRKQAEAAALRREAERSRANRQRDARDAILATVAPQRLAEMRHFASQLANRQQERLRIEGEVWKLSQGLHDRIKAAEFAIQFLGRGQANDSPAVLHARRRLDELRGIESKVRRLRELAGALQKEEAAAAAEHNRQVRQAFAWSNFTLDELRHVEYA